MAFTAGDRREAESLLSKLTTTVDAAGRSRRDIVLVLRLNPHWPASVRNALASYQSLFYGILGAAMAAERDVVDALNSELPPG